MAEPVLCKIELCINEDGDWEVVSVDNDDSAHYKLNENMGGTAFRTVRFDIWMAPPEIPTTTIRVADDVGTTATAELSPEQ